MWRSPEIQSCYFEIRTQTIYKSMDGVSGAIKWGHPYASLFCHRSIWPHYILICNQNLSLTPIPFSPVYTFMTYICLKISKGLFLQTIGLTISFEKNDPGPNESVAKCGGICVASWSDKVGPAKIIIIVCNRIPNHDNQCQTWLCYQLTSAFEIFNWFKKNWWCSVFAQKSSDSGKQTE